MATTSSFEFDKEGSVLTRNSPKSRQQETEMGIGADNNGVVMMSNGTGKSMKHLHDGFPEYIRTKSPVDSSSKPLHNTMMEYEDSDGPIYHPTAIDHGGLYGHPWNSNPTTTNIEGKQDTSNSSSGVVSLSNIIGIKDVCGNKRLWRMLIAEFIGTLFLVLIGCGSCLSGWKPGYEPGMVQIALAFGLTVAAMAQAIGHVSGCHINPAVTVGLLACGQCSLFKGICYIIFQCLGAICGAAILQAVTPEEIQGNLGMTLLNAKVEPVQGMFLEALITFVLVLVVCGVCDDLRKDVKGSAPLAIGLSISVCHLMAIQYTGSSMNPARTLGPAVITKTWTDHWVYWAGPLLGGFCAGFLYQVSFKERSDPDKTSLPESSLSIEKRRIQP